MKHHVLLVDDEPLVLEGLRRNLVGEPYSLETENRPEAALARVRRGEIDLVVSDHDMPGMNGMHLLAAVREEDPTILTFLLTGKATLDMAVAALNEGVVDRFFTKPCNHVDLKVAIRRNLERKELLEGSRRLLWRSRQQAAWISKLEHTHPDLGRLLRDDSGAILLEDVPTDPAELHKELLAYLGEEEAESGESAA